MNIAYNKKKKKTNVKAKQFLANTISKFSLCSFAQSMRLPMYLIIITHSKQREKERERKKEKIRIMHIQ